MKNHLLLSTLLFLFVFGKQFAQNDNLTGEAFTASIEKAHKKEVFLKQQSVAYNLKLGFGGKTKIEAKITQSIDGSKIRIEYKDGKNVVFDGDKVFGFPKSANFKGARFAIFTWSYFFALPYKLNDAGTIWESSKTNKWGEKDFQTNRLSFETGIGDTPKDWYIIYKNPETNVLEGTAYIVSFGKKLEAAEANPHAMKYAKFVEVNGIPFATEWTFHNWNIKEGYTDEIGRGVLSDIEFVNKEASFFEMPNADIQVIEMKK